ncbi:hypothetical protein HOP50_16g77100 [Chloropicon primus]|uniref:RRM domain-containing protein n=1 Tax=Chloropicon primus TaxID=1764295 RepID=A0A5B8N099_9CHLO|nr:hypothetical protein A3770_16p76820 [Chloropicon primus]UPR04369.1 hypothetical protein HOP50_16g77100 [Chloropicon primus]|mmetsp:Transcript_10061/g.28523  ORF Transcript_10061/g.28523 Transcript_10061/m.28523 type:complete len:299 (-) Transcript_10061:47-943(-)|eukprot:QDZ25164.1 hypothetical protein A3770_16p76820 [Chloropicon primus]
MATTLSPSTSPPRDGALEDEDREGGDGKCTSCGRQLKVASWTICNTCVQTRKRKRVTDQRAEVFRGLCSAYSNQVTDEQVKKLLEDPAVDLEKDVRSFAFTQRVEHAIGEGPELRYFAGGDGEGEGEASADRGEGDSRARRRSGDETRLYVGSLPLSMADDDLKALFEEHGTVEEASVVRDLGASGASKGYGFVKMANKDEARLAVERLDNQGSSLVVRPAGKKGGGDTVVVPFPNGCIRLVPERQQIALAIEAMAKKLLDGQPNRSALNGIFNWKLLIALTFICEDLVERSTRNSSV